MAGIGTQLRAIRLQWGLSLREVEERSVSLAQECGESAYQISGSWLARVERGRHELTIPKLISWLPSTTCRRRSYCANAGLDGRCCRHTPISSKIRIPIRHFSWPKAPWKPRHVTCCRMGSTPTYRPRRLHFFLRKTAHYQANTGEPSSVGEIERSIRCSEQAPS